KSAAFLHSLTFGRKTRPKISRKASPLPVGAWILTTRGKPLAAGPVFPHLYIEQSPLTAMSWQKSITNTANAPEKAHLRQSTAQNQGKTAYRSP
ncbi:MAG: hypothetical protein ACJ8I3_20890, partial [Paraburkholderia graminis]